MLSYGLDILLNSKKWPFGFMMIILTVRLPENHGWSSVLTQPETRRENTVQGGSDEWEGRAYQAGTC